MNDIFNTASLARLSRQELLSLLADLQGQFQAGACEAERASASAKIEAVKRALVL